MNDATFQTGEFLPSRPPTTTISTDSIEGREMGFSYHNYESVRPFLVNTSRSRIACRLANMDFPEGMFSRTWAAARKWGIGRNDYPFTVFEELE